MKLSEKLLYYLICCYIILLPLIPSQTGIKYIHFIPNLILLLIFLVFLISNLPNYKNRKDFFMNIKDFLTDYMGILLSLLFIIMIISIGYATDKKLALSEGIRFFTYIILYFIVKYSIKDKKNIKGIMNSYIFIVAIIGLIGLVQYFTGIGLERKFVYQVSDQIVKVRISGTLENPNNLGAFLVIGLFPTLMLMFKEKNRKMKVVLTVISVIALIEFYIYKASYQLKQ